MSIKHAGVSNKTGQFPSVAVSALVVLLINWAQPASCEINDPILCYINPLMLADAKSRQTILMISFKRKQRLEIICWINVIPNICNNSPSNVL